MTLREQLQNLADNSAKKIPAKAQVVMNNAIKKLKTSNILEKAFKTGDTIPKIELPNAKGVSINLNDILAKGKRIVISFYRGGWCPYCNLELKALQQSLPEIKTKNAVLIAINPETPDNSLSTLEKNNLEFEVLSDKNNEVAKSLNLVFQLPEDLQNLYKKFGINLDQVQGNTTQELPIAATYVIDTNGVILYHFLDEDYKLRADPKDILAIL
mgnify:FL=1